MTDDVRTAELAMPAAYDTGAADESAGGAAPQGGSPLKLILGMLRGRYHWAIGLGAVLGAAGAIAGYKLPLPLYRASGLIDIAAKVPKILTETDEKGLLPMFDAYVTSQAQLCGQRRVVDLAMSSPEWRAVGPSGSDEAVGAFLGGLAVAHPRHSQLIEVAYIHEDPNIATVAVNQVIKAYMQIVTEKENEGGISTLEVLEKKQSLINSQLIDLRTDVLAVTEDLGEAALQGKYEHRCIELNRIQTALDNLELEIAAAKAASSLGEIAPGVVLTEQEIGLRDHGMDNLLGRREEARARVESLESHGGLGPKNPELVNAKDALNLVERQIAERARAFRSQLASAPDVRESTLRQNEQKRALFLSERDEVLEEIRKLSKKRLTLQNIEADRARLNEQLAAVKRRIEQIQIESEGNGRITVMSYGDRPVAPYTDRRMPFAMMGAGGGLALGFGIVLLWGLRESKLRHAMDVGGSVGPRGRFLGVIPDLSPGPNAPAEPSGDPAGLSDYCVHHVRTMLQLRSPDHRTVVALTSPSPGAGKTTLGLALGMSFAASGSRTLLIDCDFVGHGLTSALRAMVCDAASRGLTQTVADASPTVVEANGSNGTNGTGGANGISGGIMVGLVTSRQLVFGEAHIRELITALGSRGRAGDAKAARAAETLEALSRPKTNGTNGHRARRGVLGAMDGRPLAECVVETECPNLSVLPVGDADPSDAERLSRAGLERLVDQCRERYDTVLIDTGPVLGSIEAAFVTTVADEVLLVVSRGERRPSVDEAIERIDEFGAEVAGVVFNRATSADVARTSYASRSKSRASEEA